MRDRDELLTCLQRLREPTRDDELPQHDGILEHRRLSAAREAERSSPCYYAAGSGATQTAQAPLAFVRGYTNTSPTNTQPPQLESVWLTP